MSFILTWQKNICKRWKESLTEFVKLIQSRATGEPREIWGGHMVPRYSLKTTASWQVGNGSLYTLKVLLFWMKWRIIGEKETEIGTCLERFLSHSILGRGQYKGQGFTQDLDPGQRRNQRWPETFRQGVREVGVGGN